jgi:signal transduction histidine kinase
VRKVATFWMHADQARLQTGLSDKVPPTQFEAEFKQHERVHALSMARSICVYALALNVMYAPIASLVVALHPVVTAVLLRERIALTLLCVAYLAALHVAPKWSQLWRLPYVLGWCLALSVGIAAGRLAEIEHYWYFAIYMTPVVSAVVAGNLIARAAFAASLVVCAHVGFLWQFHRSLSHEYWLHGVQLFVTAACAGVAAGQEAHRHLRINFDLGIRVQHQAAELYAQRSQLADEVETRTAELRHLAERADGLLEEERRRMARELHDGLGQELVALQLQLAVATNQATATGATAAQAALSTMHKNISRAQEGLRRVLSSLRPRVLELQGLPGALRSLADEVRSDELEVTVHIALKSAISESAELAVYRIVQEALSNAAHHANASIVDVTLQGEAGEVLATIEDNGSGIHLNDGTGYGLLNMRERATAIGGKLVIVPSHGGQGTRIELRLPKVAA